MGEKTDSTGKEDISTHERGGKLWQRNVLVAKMQLE